jgi:hypothetical protein
VRTTLTIDERIARDLKEIAHKSGKPLKQVVNETLASGLAARKPARRRRRYRVKPVSLGSALVDIDKALSLADVLEDQEIARKLELRK